MQTYQQQLVANVLKLFGVYRRTKDEAVLEIVEGLLGCLRDTLETVQPTIVPGIVQPAKSPYDPGGVYVYACPIVDPFTYTGTTTESSDTITIKPGSTVAVDMLVNHPRLKPGACT